ncbi:hypothetical protein B0T26DRAFT_434847 [Lasiosphaeria miniovina]|uniref:C2H2-type domain-containing protein n=1 Tax=Lasiosphaeria miniovina TaxID=1954250 RepID=A0AA40DR03_9PEZI|nr:uncharacterized protein B0T26DRAFT_434847 [Lasiosphaeria miniovina]KAK0710271.1 hypothetical protein B0T26DRAFT_434847 [Lasiosphaeria miniovina]
MNYHTFWETWHRLWLVSGNRVHQRPYSLRVGAGSKLDRVFTPALRSHFMGNSEGIFQKLYLPEQLRKEVMPIIFGTEAAGTHDELYTMLRHATLKRDENAPIYPTVDEVKNLEERSSIQQLKHEYEAIREKQGSDHRDSKRASNAYLTHKRELITLIVQGKRKKYFEETDRRRALGQSTSDLSTPTANLYKPLTRTADTDKVAIRIGHFLREKDLGGHRRARVFSQLLLAYLGNRSTEVETIMNSLENNKTQDVAKQTEDWQCLFCLKHFAYRGGLTRYNQDHHFSKSAFDRPFPCDECGRQGKMHDVEGAEQWSNHVEKCHGIKYTPKPPRHRKDVRPTKRKPTKERSDRCFFCENMFFEGSSHSRHFNKDHGSIFLEPFACFECGRQGCMAVIESRAAWMDHAADVHKRDGHTMAKVPEQAGVLGKRKRGVEKGRLASAASEQQADQDRQRHLGIAPMVIDPRLLGTW